MFPMTFPNFSMHCPRVFPIAPHFCPIWFAQSSSLLITYRDGPKGEVLHLHVETSIFEDFQSLRVFFLIIGQSKWLVVLINS
jgi:hypothetical protein